MPFQKATKKGSHLRMLISGPAKAGKTYTALTVGTTLARHRGGRVALIDTEFGSARKYADLFDFDTIDLTAPYSVDRYIALMHEAEQAGYVVIIVDSLTHGWIAEGGLLEEVDNIAARQAAARSQRAPDSFSAWNEAGRVQDRLYRTILGSPADVICTVRSKQKYEIVTGQNGKKTPTKMGIEPQQRDDLQFVFDLHMAMDMESTGVIDGRVIALQGAVIKKPDATLADTLFAWLEDETTAPLTGPAPTPRQPVAKPVPSRAAVPVTPAQPARPSLGSQTPRQVPTTVPEPPSDALAGLPTVAGPFAVDTTPSLGDLQRRVNVAGWHVSGEAWAERSRKGALWASQKRTDKIDGLLSPELERLLGVLVNELPPGTDVDKLPPPPEEASLETAPVVEGVI